MASLQVRNGSYRVLFCHRGKRHTFTLGRVSEREAQGKAEQVDYLLMRIRQGLLHVPAGVDIADFLLRDGQGPGPAAARGPAAEPVSLRRLREDYLETHRNGAMEASSLSTAAIHLAHFERTLGESYPAGSLTLADLQRYVNERSRKKYRGRPLSPATVRKEVAGFRAAWNWAVLNGLVAVPFPGKGLVYPKLDEKPPFQTWAEIERKLPGLSGRERAELWNCLFLTQPEVSELLEYVGARCTQPWVYPAVCFAAHTGARRSEVIRVGRHDLDLGAGTVLIQEKKRARGKRTTRRVPLSPFLAGVLKEWLTRHLGGAYLFCSDGVVPRSRKRSRTTGHRGEGARASTAGGRTEGVRVRDRPGPSPLTRDEAHDHFQRTLAGGKWGVLRGWHVLRHSFVSNCAAKGVDQRLIDAWVGHTTEEMRKRYRHLIPSAEQAAIRAVFDG
jgi:integrase